MIKDKLFIHNNHVLLKHYYDTIRAVDPKKLRII